jgi:hypothetical protein
MVAEHLEQATLVRSHAHVGYRPAESAD